MKEFVHKKLESIFLEQDLTCAPTGNPFYNRKVVFTGDLKGWDRNTAAYLLQQLGADVNTSISRKTEVVIIGSGCGPSKLEKIIDLLADGVQIRLMNERIFEKEVAPYKDLIGLS